MAKLLPVRNRPYDTLEARADDNLLISKNGLRTKAGSIPLLEH